MYSDSKIPVFAARHFNDAHGRHKEQQYVQVRSRTGNNVIITKGGKDRMVSVGTGPSSAYSYDHVIPLLLITLHKPSTTCRPRRLCSSVRRIVVFWTFFLCP